MEWKALRRSGAPQGFTLVEVLLVLGFMGVILGAGLPRVRDLQDRIAVRSAREAAVGFLARARYHAVLRGGARVRATEERSVLTLASSAGVVDRRDLSSLYGVEMEIRGISRDAREVVLPFDPMGLGRFTSRTLELRRGDAVARLIVSSYGRVRRA